MNVCFFVSAMWKQQCSTSWLQKIKELDAIKAPGGLPWHMGSSSLILCSGQARVHRRGGDALGSGEVFLSVGERALALTFEG